MNISRGGLPAALGDMARRVRILERRSLVDDDPPFVEQDDLDYAWVSETDGGTVADSGGGTAEFDDLHDGSDDGGGSTLVPSVDGIEIKRAGLYMCAASLDFQKSAGDYTSDPAQDDIRVYANLDFDPLDTGFMNLFLPSWGTISTGRYGAGSNETFWLLAFTEFFAVDYPSVDTTVKLAYTNDSGVEINFNHAKMLLVRLSRFVT